MEKKRTYKSKRGGVYELVQLKAPEKKKKKISAGKEKPAQAASEPKKEAPKKAATKKAAPKKATKSQKMAGKARAVKRARKSSRKRKPGQMALL